MDPSRQGRDPSKGKVQAGADEDEAGVQTRERSSSIHGMDPGRGGNPGRVGDQAGKGFKQGYTISPHRGGVQAGEASRRRRGPCWGGVQAG